MSNVREMEPLTGRVYSHPWYRDPAVIGSNFRWTGPDDKERVEPVFALTRRDEMFMSEVDVAAYLTMAVATQAAIRLDWLQMASDPMEGTVSPTQHQRSGVHVAAVFMATRSFVVADARNSQIFQISFDAVINIGFEL